MSEIRKSSARARPSWDHYEGAAPLVDHYRLTTLDKQVFYFALGQLAGQPTEERSVPIRTLNRFAMTLDDVRGLHRLLGRVLADTEKPE